MGGANGREDEERLGALREPLLKVAHVLRSLEYATRDGREVELADLVGRIGEEPHKMPSVFNFYQPEYAPEGAVADAGQRAPEGLLATSPYLLGFANRPRLSQILEQHQS